MRSLPWALTGLAALLFACTDVADERAERDEAVGHYRSNAMRIDVEDGLAVIREARRDRVTLWSSAPVWVAKVTRDTDAPLTIAIRNLVAGSSLEATDPAGKPIDVQLVDESLPTRRTFLVESPAHQMWLRLKPPQAQRPSTFRFAVLGDIQGAIGGIRDIYRRMAEEQELDFVISPGDLTEQGTRGQLERFERELETLLVPFYSTLGNHELGTTPPPYQALFGRANLHFHYRGTAFSLIDSGSATLSPRSMDWLEGWLDEDRARPHVFVTHYPPIDPIGVRNGSFASRAEAHQLIARLAEGKIDLCLHGHIHSFYAFTMAGIPAYISGGGGAIPERFDDIGRHFLVVQIGADERGVGRLEDVRIVRVD